MKKFRLSLFCALMLASANAPAAALLDGSFETQASTVGTYCSFFDCPEGAWTEAFEGGNSPVGLKDESAEVPSGVSTNPGRALEAADGSKYAFLRSSGSSLVQGLTSDTTGLFTLSWFDASGGNFGASYNVIVDGTPEIGGGTLVGQYSVFNQDFTSRSSIQFNLTSGTFYTFRFVPTNSAGDHLYIDNVSLNAVTSPNPVPEPTTWAMMVMGLGAVGTALRRRPRRALATA